MGRLMHHLGRDRIEGAPEGGGNDVVIVVRREQGELVLDAIAPVGDSHGRKVSRGVVGARARLANLTDQSSSVGGHGSQRCFCDRDRRWVWPG